MAKRVTARINHELLGWARHSARLSIDDIADRLKVESTRAEAWERGDDAPSVPQLRKWADACKRPLAVFYLPEPPKDFDAMRDFRRMPGHVQQKESPELAAEIRWAHQMREVAVETFALAQINVPGFDLRATMGEEASVVADRIRDLLGLTLHTQLSWRDKYEALNGWRTAFESVGIICLQFSGVSVREARGFSILYDHLPVIAVNARDVPHARVFSLLHETAHLMLGSTGLCDLSTPRRGRRKTDAIEVFCNKVAGETLVPTVALRKQAVVREHHQGTAWSDDELNELASSFHVSQEVVVRRLVTIRLAPYGFYHDKREEYLGWVENTKTQSGGNYYNNLRAKIGSPVIVGVISAYHQGRITANDASAFLGVKVKNLRRLFDTAVGA